MAANLSEASKSTERIINRYRTWFCLKPYDLNLKANMGISEIIKSAMARVEPYNTAGENRMAARPNVLCKNISNKPITKIVAAGVASPIKPSVWRVSTLNLAKRSAANKVKIKAGAEYK